MNLNIDIGQLMKKMRRARESGSAAGVGPSPRRDWAIILVAFAVLVTAVSYYSHTVFLSTGERSEGVAFQDNADDLEGQFRSIRVELVRVIEVYETKKTAFSNLSRKGYDIIQDPSRFGTTMEDVLEDGASKTGTSSEVSSTVIRSTTTADTESSAGEESE